MTKLIIIGVLFLIIGLISALQKKGARKAIYIMVNILLLGAVGVGTLLYGPPKYQLDLNSTVAVGKSHPFVVNTINPFWPFPSTSSQVIMKYKNGQNNVLDFPKEITPGRYQPYPFYKQYFFFLLISGWGLLNVLYLRKYPFNKKGETVPKQTLLEQINQSKNLLELESIEKKCSEIKWWRPLYKRSLLKSLQQRKKQVREDLGLGFQVLAAGICKRAPDSNLITAPFKPTLLSLADLINQGASSFTVKVQTQTELNIDLEEDLEPNLVRYISHFEPEGFNNEAKRTTENYSNSVIDTRTTAEYSDHIDDYLQLEMKNAFLRLLPPGLLKVSDEASAEVVINVDLYRFGGSLYRTHTKSLCLSFLDDPTWMVYYSNDVAAHISIHHNGEYVSSRFLLLDTEEARETSMYFKQQANITEKGSLFAQKDKSYRDQMHQLVRLNILRNLLINEIGLAKFNPIHKVASDNVNETELNTFLNELATEVKSACKSEISDQSKDIIIEYISQHHPEIITEATNIALNSLVEIGFGAEVAQEIIASIAPDAFAELIVAGVGES